MDNRLNILLSLLNGNPQQIMNNNPQFKAILNQAQNSGMSMRDFTMQYAKQNNIDIQPMLDMLAQRGFRI